MAAIGTLHIPSGCGNDIIRDLVLRTAIGTDQTHQEGPLPANGGLSALLWFSLATICLFAKVLRQVGRCRLKPLVKLGRRDTHNEGAIW
jgi:hypothetical protein